MPKENFENKPKKPSPVFEALLQIREARLARETLKTEAQKLQERNGKP